MLNNPSYSTQFFGKCSDTGKYKTVVQYLIQKQPTEAVIQVQIPKHWDEKRCEIKAGGQEIWLLANVFNNNNSGELVLPPPSLLGCSTKSTRNCHY